MSTGGLIIFSLFVRIPSGSSFSPNRFRHWWTGLQHRRMVIRPGAFAILVVLLLDCSCSSGQKPREADAVSRFNRFVESLKACDPGGSTAKLPKVVAKVL